MRGFLFLDYSHFIHVPTIINSEQLTQNSSNYHQAETPQKGYRLLQPVPTIRKTSLVDRVYWPRISTNYATKKPTNPFRKSRALALPKSIEPDHRVRTRQARFSNPVLPHHFDDRGYSKTTTRIFGTLPPFR